MKDVIFTLQILLACNTLIAQHDFGISVKCGTSIRWSKSDPDAVYFYRLSGGIGGIYNYKWPKGCGVHLELALGQFHSKDKGSTYYDGYWFRIRGANYLCMPITISYSFGPLTFYGGMQFNLGAKHGGYWAYHVKLDGSITSPYLDHWLPERFHFGTKLGLNYQFSKKFSLGVSYYQQLFDLTEPKFYWTCFDFGVNYSIQRKKAQPLN